MKGSRPSPALPAERRLALVVATASYRDAGLRQLRAPARDAAELGELLGDPAVGGFEVTTVLDRSAQRIRLAVEEFLADRRPDDLVVVYLSCHGLIDARRRLYFAAQDTMKNRLASTGVEAEWLLSQLEDCRARRQVVILDCCFSGAFGGRAKGSDDLGLDSRFHGQGRGRVVLTASRGTEYSFEGEPLADAVQPGSVFTSALVAGIRSGEADRDHDGYISVDDAYEYAFDRLRDAAVAQTPQRSVYQAEGKILLARSPAGVPVEAVALPESLRSALDSPHPAVRLGGVTALGELLDDPALAAQARKALEDVAANDVPQVALAAKAHLVSPVPEVPAPPKPSRRRNVPLLAGIAVAVAIALTVTLVLVLRPNTTPAVVAPELHTVAFSPDGKLLATGGIESGATSIRLWDATSWQLTKIPLGGDPTVYDIAFSPDGGTFAVGCDDGVRIFDTGSRKLVAGPFGVSTNSRVHGSASVAFSPDKKTIAIGDFDGSVQLWDLATRTALTPSMIGHTGSIDGLAFSPDGKVLASAGGYTFNEDNSYSPDGTVRLWDTGTRQQIGDPLINERASAAALGVAFAPQGEKLAVGYSARDNLVWDIGTRKPIATLPGGNGDGTDITYSHAGYLIAAGDSYNVRVWNADTTKVIRDLKGHTNDVTSLAFSPDDGRLASASRDGTVRVWDPATGQLLKQLNA
ncbi:caspase, EACC1-associated type [Kutzneria sp. CA-103260]|uniref:caspase, EACC1-associated type n=1 Tax=Kutzneria sp. CA-103260 TaxID=2802641 RepID=UPI001BAA5169|nr:caspase family protein [Kutzneria sp. CA-103260]QUQ63353.1 WD domain, G-beta repeat [Kutzneria sp. CA-103260]